MQHNANMKHMTGAHVEIRALSVVETSVMNIFIIHFTFDRFLKRKRAQ